MVETFNALVKALSKNESGDVITAEYEDLVMKPIQAAIAELDGLDHLHKLNMIETDKDLGTMMWCALGTMFDVVSDNSNAEELLRKSVMDFESFFDTLHVDKNQISVVEGYTTAYKNLSRVLMESDDKEEALLILDRCRAKALTYQLLSKHKIRKDVIGEEAEISMEKIASLVNTNNYAILFYALHYSCLWIFVVQSTEGDNGENCASLDFHCLNIDAEFIDALGGHEDAIPSSFKSRAMVDEDDQDTSRHQDYCCGAMRAGPPSENDDNSCYDGTASNNASSDMNRRLEKLYDGLLSPFLSKITAPEIVIIPEGPLYSLPFAALQHPTTQRYLSQDKRLRFSPSLTNLTLHLRVPEDYHSHSGSLIIGDPTNDEIPDLIDLPGSRKEAVRIAELIGGVQPLIGRQATKSAVLERLPEVCIIHLACHISLFKSVIILASKKERAPEDEEYNYLLKPEEVMKTKVRARLVVLSGCNSGRGEVSAEGVVGIARAFLAAGASAVLVSRWKVDDNTTCEFMETFYTYLLDWDQRRSASESLHLTINDMRKKYPHDPMKWSGFFLMGDDVTIDRERLSVLRDSQPTSQLRVDTSAITFSSHNAVYFCISN
ncbi:hypothetical protein QZH41_001497 [Actinostola sp. cb2023]|nr:hypothetical protein QZH41_001497 [Actinostola sp. cb2023]